MGHEPDGTAGALHASTTAFDSWMAYQSCVVSSAGEHSLDMREAG